jgi:hypothetical protein
VSGPHDLIFEEREPLFLAAAWSPEDAADYRGLTVDEATITEEWMFPVALSEAQQADEEYQGFINPDWEPGDPPVSHEYVTCKPDRPGAAKYLRVAEKRERAEEEAEPVAERPNPEGGAGVLR